MSEFVKLDGLKEVQEALIHVPIELRKKVIYKLLRKAAQPIVKAAKADAPKAERSTRRVISGLLKKSLGVRQSKIKQPSRGDFGVFITATTPPGIKRIKRKARKAGIQGPNFGDPFYHRFQEGGFHAVGSKRIKGGKRNRAANLKASGAQFISGKKYLGNAFEANRNRFVETFRTDIVQAIVKSFEKKAKR